MNLKDWIGRSVPVVTSEAVNVPRVTIPTSVASTGVRRQYAKPAAGHKVFPYLLRDVKIEIADLPLSAALLSLVGEVRARELALAGGDDYELVFTTPPARRTEVETLGAELGLVLSRIGHIAGQGGATDVGHERLRVWAGELVEPGQPSGAPLPKRWASFDHFRAGESA